MASTKAFLDSGLFTMAELQALERELSQRDPALLDHCPLDAQRLRSKDAVAAYGVWLYALVRKYQPRTSVETGVQNGSSTELILWALYRNGRGQLHSIDSGPTSSDGSHRTASHKTDIGMPGRCILDPLKSRWRLTIGLSRDTLPSLCAAAQPIELFWHDSDHSPENIAFEFGTVKSLMAPHGMLCLHDYHGQCTTLDADGFDLLVPHTEPLLRVWRCIASTQTGKTIVPR